jgi:hypothetical protein
MVPRLQRVRRLARATVLVGVAACSPLKHAPPRAHLVFRNESLDQADVYAVISGAQTIRIGTVFPGHTDTLTVPDAALGRGNVVVVARLLARRVAPQSGPIPIRAGELLEVTLPMDAKLLSVLPARP